MKRAFVFTLDAIFAITLLSIFLVAISFEINTPRESYWLPQLADTFMTSLDKNGVFYQIYSQGCIGSQIPLRANLSTLPDNINAQMRVRIYHGDSVTKTFAIKTNCDFTVNKGTVSQEQKTLVKRVFSDPKNNDFGIVETVFSYA